MQVTTHVDADDAHQLVGLAKAEAARIEVPMSFAVVDAGGHPLLIERMPGANWLSPDIARAKAFAAAAMRIDSAAVKQRFAEAPYLVTAVAVQTNGRFMAQGGAVPITVAGEVVGAIGASGGTAVQDHDVVSAAVAEFLAAQ